MKNFLNSNLNIKSIALCCYVAPGTGAPVHTNRKNHGIVFYPEGNNTFDFHDKSIVTKPNSILYLPKGSNYVVSHKSHSECYAINFDIDEEVNIQPFMFMTKNSQGFLDLFKKAELIWKAQKNGFEIKCKSLTYDIIYQMIKEYNLGYVSKSKSDLLSPALDYIHNNYTYDNISIAFLSQKCGISETYFRGLFNKTFGTSPIKYINNLKISRACDLLLSDMYSISEIAQLSGFHDESYFSREFKKSMGITPSEYK